MADPSQGQQEELAHLLAEEKKADLAQALREAFLALTRDDGPTLATITAQPSTEQVRAVALDYAIGYHNWREGTPEKVVSTAAVFFAYIMNGASA
jgi:hypothetical protein